VNICTFPVSTTARLHLSSTVQSFFEQKKQAPATQHTISA
jgi:hypothetical protein